MEDPTIMSEDNLEDKVTDVWEIVTGDLLEPVFSERMGQRT
jgi:hypothetical protein